MVWSRDATALAPNDLRELAIAARDAIGEDAVVVVLGANDGKAALVAAVGKARVAAGVSAAELVAPVVKLLGGGTAKDPALVQGGGKNADALDDAERVARARVADAVG